MFEKRGLDFGKLEPREFSCCYSNKAFPRWRTSLQWKGHKVCKLFCRFPYVVKEEVCTLKTLNLFLYNTGFCDLYILKFGT